LIEEGKGLKGKDERIRKFVKRRKGKEYDR